jgi:predicted Zn-ribbon and HTH transcriptional regulator
MPRPPVEVADIIRAAGESFFEDSRKWLTWLHLKVLNAILRCRTAALGGHVDACSKCGHEAISFNSCRNRHCPKCQRTVKIFSRYQGASRNGCLKALRGAGFL